MSALHSVNVSGRPLGTLIGCNYGVVVPCPKCGLPSCVKAGVGKKTRRYVHVLDFAPRTKREGKGKGAPVKERFGTVKAVVMSFCQVEV